MKKEKSITRTTGDFIADGFKPGDTIHCEFGDGPHRRYTIKEITSEAIVVRGSGFLESVKYYLRRIALWSNRLWLRFLTSIARCGKFITILFGVMFLQ